MTARTSKTTSVPTWLYEQQQRILSELRDKTISHGESLLQLQLAAELARRLINNGNQRKVVQ
jgi:hypothetical protein